MIVTDDGAGIDPALLPTLFQFGASTKGSKGNGMGLWTIKHIMNRHGGTVHVHSPLGEGTHFNLCWPRRFRGTSQRAAAKTGLRPAGEKLILAAQAVGVLDATGNPQR